MKNWSNLNFKKRTSVRKSWGVKCYCFVPAVTGRSGRVTAQTTLHCNSRVSHSASASINCSAWRGASVAALANGLKYPPESVPENCSSEIMLVSRRTRVAACCPRQDETANLRRRSIVSLTSTPLRKCRPRTRTRPPLYVCVRACGFFEAPLDVLRMG